MTTISSRHFNQDVSAAKRAAEGGPVIITDRGRPAYVLMTHAEFRRISEPRPGIRDLLAHPETQELEFQPPRLGEEPVQAADL